MKSEEEIRQAMQTGDFIDNLSKIIKEPFRSQVKNVLIGLLKWVLEE